VDEGATGVLEFAGDQVGRYAPYHVIAEGDQVIHHVQCIQSCRRAAGGVCQDLVRDLANFLIQNELGSVLYFMDSGLLQVTSCCARWAQLPGLRL
jgi:hypothetical protein